MADLDDYLRYLADQRRRHLLYRLADEDATTVEELAASLSGPLPGPASRPTKEIDDVSVELQHHYLPRLDELAVIEYDRRNGVVDVREIPVELETLLDSTRELELAD